MLSRKLLASPYQHEIPTLSCERTPVSRDPCCPRLRDCCRAQPRIPWLTRCSEGSPRRGSADACESPMTCRRGIAEGVSASPRQRMRHGEIAARGPDAPCAEALTGPIAIRRQRPRPRARTKWLWPDCGRPGNTRWEHERGTTSGRPRSFVMNSLETSTKCGRRDSNPQGLRHRHLKPACLPIPPRPRALSTFVPSTGGIVCWPSDHWHGSGRHRHRASQSR
ncbi:MAG: hypothetical protein QOE31_1818 [Solirubrobacteraceae bacterium]|nr:hypothetical protein [Solirubrobacteraceae bacterium]